MISSRHKFIFVHIPKTAGNAISVALAPHVDDEVRITRSIGETVDDPSDQGVTVLNPALGIGADNARKHVPLKFYARRLGAAFADYYVFSVLRDPLDRLVSRMAFKAGLTLNKPIPADELLFPKPHAEYLTVDGAVRVDRLIRFEHLQADFDRVCEDIGIPPVALVPRNRSSHDAFEEYFDDTTRRIVREHFRCDEPLRQYTFG